MTKSNDGWVPERFNAKNMPDIGSVISFKNYAYHDHHCNFYDGDECEVLAYKKHPDSGQTVLIVWNNRNNILDSFLPEMFTPIKTEAEKRREKRIIEALTYVKHDYSPDSLEMASTKEYVIDAVEQLVDANWIKPKPLNIEALDKILRELCKVKTQTVIDIANAVEAHILGETP